MPKYTDPTTGKSFSSKEPLNEYELEEAFGVVGGKTEPQPTQDKGFLSRVGEDIGKRWENIKNIDAPTYGQASLRGVGQIAGMGNDIIGQGLVSAYKTVVPDVAQEAIAGGAKKVFSTPLVQGAVKGVTEAYGGFKEDNPNLARDVEAIANIGMFVPAAKGIGMAGKEGLNIAKDVAYAIGKPASQILDSTIRRSVEKAIRPSVSKQGTSNLTQKYYENASNAVKNIVTNRGKLVLTDAEGIALEDQLPQTLKQFSEAVGQTKKAIYDQYHNMAAEAGKQGATFDTTRILSKLDGVSGDLKFNPQVREYANSLKKEIAELHGQPPEVIEARIADLNQSLVGFFEGRVGAAKVKVDASVAGLMREELDDIITKTLEQSGYQGLKKSYGSLKAIEKDVAHRSGVYARLNKKGLIDFTDIFTSGEIVAGLATMNPALLAKGVTMKAVKEYIKYVNNPNYIVKTMFKDVDDIIKREAAGFKSASFRGAERKLPGNPLSKSDIPTVPPGSYYSKKTTLPSTEVKSGRIKGEPYGAERMKINRQKGLPPGQGFSLSGEPYTPDVIDAIFTARSRPIPERPSLDIPRRDATLELPAGQGFVFRDKPPIIPETPKPVISEPPKQEFIGSGLRAARERMAAQASVKEKVSENIVTRVQQLGGITAGKDYNSKILRQNPDAKRVLKNTGGKSPDEIAAQLMAEGWPIKSSDELIELLKTGKGRTIFNPENLEKLHERYINKKEREWIERRVID